MKSALFAITLLAGTAALAQTDPQTTTIPPTDPVTAPATQPADPVTPPPADSWAPATTTTPAPMTMAQPMSQTVAPSNADPEHDARGIAVISDAATAPPGFNQAAGMTGMGGPLADPSQPPATEPATEDYPACSRTVTDNCVQTYERRRAR